MICENWNKILSSASSISGREKIRRRAIIQEIEKFSPKMSKHKTELNIQIG